MRKFVEYLDSRGKIEKPKVKVVADEVDLPSGRDKKPPKGVGMKDNQQPYINDKGKVSRSSGQKAFGEQGERDLVYDVTKETKPAVLPTAEALSLFNRTRAALQGDPTLMEHLVRELKRNGLLGAMVGELACHTETFRALAELMANESYGPDVCKKFARALVQEDVSPPFTDQKDPNADALDGNNGISGDADGIKDDDDQNLVPDDDQVPPDDSNMIDDGDEDDDLSLDDGDGDEQDPMSAGSPDLAAGAQGAVRSHPMQPMPTKAMEHLNTAFGRYLKG